MDTNRTLGIASDGQVSLGRLASGVGRAFTSGLVAPVLIGAYVVLTPVIGTLPGFGLFDGQRVLQLLVLGIATVPLLFHEARARWLETFSALPVAARIGLATVLGMGCLSASLAPLPRFAFLEVALFALLFIAAITLASQFRRDVARANRWILTTLALGMLAYTASFAMGYVLSLVFEWPVWPKASTGFAHVRLFNQYQAWTLPLVVLPAMLLPVKRSSARYAMHALAAMWYALLFASGGRGMALAMIGGLVVMVVMFRRRALQWLRLHLVALATGLVLYVVLFIVLADNLSVFERLQDITQDSGRFELWALALDMTGRHPLLGEGPMQFARHINGHAAHPHNAVLQWAAEWGLPSLAVVGGLVVWGFAAWVTRCKQAVQQGRDAERDLFLVAVTASLAVAAAYSLVDGVIVMPLSQLLLVAVIGWVLAIYGGSEPLQGTGRASSAATVMLLALIAAAGAGVGQGVAPDVLSLEERQRDYAERERPGWMHPRFWQQGHIEP